MSGGVPWARTGRDFFFFAIFSGMSITNFLCSVGIDLVQASDYAAGGSVTLSASADLVARYGDRDASVSARVTVDRSGAELSDGVPEGFWDEIRVALEQYIELSVNDGDRMGTYGMLAETGGKVSPRHRYRAVVYAYGTPDEPEFRIVPTCAVTRAECRAELEAGGYTWR